MLKPGPLRWGIWFPHRRGIRRDKSLPPGPWISPLLLYSVLWNKLYCRILLTGNNIQFTSELKWPRIWVFNMQYIQYAEHLH